VQTVVMVAAIGVLAVIAFSDVRTRRVPNVLSAAIAVLGVVKMILARDPLATAHTLEASTVVFAMAFLLFWRGVLGGGDAKLVAGMALLIGYHDLLSFLFLMSLCGGALALAILARDKLRPQRWHPPRSTVGPNALPVQTTVPYGVAIAAAGAITLILQTSLTE
jgi:prepilin peptidase CpaA